MNGVEPAQKADDANDASSDANNQDYRVGITIGVDRLS